MPEDKTRETLLEEAFTESGGKVGALTLRKFSLASVNLCKRMGISLVLDSRVLKGDVEAGVLPLWRNPSFSGNWCRSSGHTMHQ